jgi:BON domain-containing protein
MDTRTAGGYPDDHAISSAVRTRLAADPTLTAVGVTTQQGVVYLTGTVPSADRASRATQLAQQVSGVRQVVNQVRVASATPPAVTVVTPPAAATSPAPSAVIPGHPPVAVSGIVAAYDPRTNIVTFQDGRMVKIRSGKVWQPAGIGTIQPGQAIYAQDAEPVGMRVSNAPTQMSGWRMATVDRVDDGNGIIYFTDGSAVRVTASTPITVNGQRIALSQVQPGAQIAVRIPDPVAPSQPSTGGYAFPRAGSAPMPSTEVWIFPDATIR